MEGSRRNQKQEESVRRKQEESVILKSTQGQLYTKVHLLFQLSILGTTYEVAFIQDYSAVPHSMLSEDNQDTGLQSLMLENLPNSMRFISPGEFVCTTFIVNTDDNWINHYLVNDIIDKDMFLRLNL